LTLKSLKIELRLSLPSHTRMYTVTRLDVIFRYPDLVPLTHFVHRAKKVFGREGLNFLLSFMPHRNFLAV